MTDSKRGPSSDSRVLATDLDGTWIPLDGSARNASDVVTLAAQLRDSDVQLVLVTGRHLIPSRRQSANIACRVLASCRMFGLIDVDPGT